MKNYYILSLKWTRPNEAAFVFWRENNNGYCWYREWAGLYSEETVKSHLDYYDDHESDIAIEASIIDPLWKRCRYDGKEVHLLLNTPEIREKLGIGKKKFRGGMSEIHMSEIEVLN